MNDFQMYLTTVLALVATMWCLIGPTRQVQGWRALTILATLAATGATLGVAALIGYTPPNLTAAVLGINIVYFVFISRAMGTA